MRNCDLSSLLHPLNSPHSPSISIYGVTLQVHVARITGSVIGAPQLHGKVMETVLPNAMHYAILVVSSSKQDRLSPVTVVSSL